MKKNASVVVYDFPSKTGGYKMSILSCIQHYKQIYDEVDLLVITPERPPLDLGTVELNTVNLIELKKTSYWRRFIGSIVAQVPSYSYQYWKRLSEILAWVKKDADIHLHGVSLWFLRDHLGTNKRIWLHSHDVMTDAFSNVAGDNLVLKIAWKFEIKRIRSHEKRHLQNNNFNTCITEFDKRRYLELYGVQQIEVFYRTVTFPRLKEQYVGNFKFLSIGSLDLRKSHGMRKFLDITWPKIKSISSKAELHLYGRGSEVFDSPADSVYGWGYLDKISVDLSEFDFFVNPQIVGSGLQFKSLYAILSGFILISTDLGLEGISRIQGSVYELDEFLYQLKGNLIEKRYKSSFDAVEDYRESLKLSKVKNQNKFLEI